MNQSGSARLDSSAEHSRSSYKLNKAEKQRYTIDIIDIVQRTRCEVIKHSLAQ